MEKLLQVVERLRLVHGFRGYVHLKALPGASAELIRRAGLCVDRLSVNIELPSQASLCLLAPDKSRAGILGPMGLIGEGIQASRAEWRARRPAPRFAPAGHTTQMIIGASPETDQQILTLASSLYRKFALKRVYYSAYCPVGGSRSLPALRHPPLLREHRLYQADWLVRCYGFDPTEVLDAEHPQLDEQLDPKAGWALRNPQFFPVDINRASYEELVRIPGIGLRTAKRLVAARRFGAVRFDGLGRMGAVLKRARFFIVCPGMERFPVRVSLSQVRAELESRDELCEPKLLASGAPGKEWQPLLLEPG